MNTKFDVKVVAQFVQCTITGCGLVLDYQIYVADNETPIIDQYTGFNDYDVKRLVSKFHCVDENIENAELLDEIVPELWSTVTVTILNNVVKVS